MVKFRSIVKSTIQKIWNLDIELENNALLSSFTLAGSSLSFWKVVWTADRLTSKYLNFQLVAFKIESRLDEEMNNL